MKSAARLKLVDQAEAPKDVTMLLRKDIEARDWSRVHIEGDRAPAFVWEKVRRIWRG